MISAMDAMDSFPVSDIYRRLFWPDDWDGEEERGQWRTMGNGLRQVVYSRKMEIDDDDVCSICLDDRKAGQLIVQLPSCVHQFHDHCFSGMYSWSNKCPICRAQFVLKQQYSKYFILFLNIIFYWIKQAFYLGSEYFKYFLKFIFDMIRLALEIVFMFLREFWSYELGAKIFLIWLFSFIYLNEKERALRR